MIIKKPDHGVTYNYDAGIARTVRDKLEQQLKEEGIERPNNR